ncbi:MAG: hypothetical protein R3D89_07900 [Sphingomonadaceae bacterium]
MIEALLQYKHVMQLLALLLVVFAAFRWGAAPEKVCAAALAFMEIVDWPYHLIFDRFAIRDSIDPGHLLIDLAAGVALIFIGLRANRIFPIVMAGTQIVSFLSHFARALSPSSTGAAYGMMAAMPSYLLIATLAVGIYLHRKRAVHYGPYRSWNLG